MTIRVPSLSGRPGHIRGKNAFCSLLSGIRANRSALVLSVVAVIICITGLAISDPKTVFWDFRSAYYPAGVAVLHGASLSPLIHKGIWGFVNLPLLAWLFAPFALLPAKIAALLFTLIGLCALVLAYLLLVDLAGLKSQGRAWLLLIMAANGPLIYSVKLGNTSHIVLAMLAGGLWLLRHKRPGLAGVLLGAAALIKLPLLLFGLYFLFRRKYHAAAGFLGLIALSVATSIILFGVHLHLQWYEDAIKTFNSHVLAAFNVQSVQSFLTRLKEPPPPLADWRLYRPPLTLRLEALTVTIILYAIFVWSCIWRKPTSGPDAVQDRHEEEYMALMVLCLISSPLAWTHYYCWLLLPVAFAIGRIAKGNPTSWIVVVAILLTTPPVVLLNLTTPGLAAIYEKILVSCYLFGGLIWFFTLTFGSLGRVQTQRPIKNTVLKTNSHRQPYL